MTICGRSSRWSVVAVVLGLAVAAKSVLAGLLGVAFEVGGGGVEEQQVDLEVEQVRHREEHRFLHRALGVGLDQQVHRPIRLVLVHHGQAGDDHVLTDPFGGRELAHRLDRPVGHQREQHTLHVRGEPSPVGGPLDRRCDPQLLPQPVQQPGCPDRAGVEDLHRRCPGGQARFRTVGRGGPGALAAEVLGDRRRQPAQAVHVELVDPPQVHQHVRLDLALDPAVVRQRGVADNRAVGVRPLREPQVHDHSQAQHPQPVLESILKSCYYAFGLSESGSVDRKSLTCGFVSAINLVWPRTAEAGSSRWPVSP